MHFIFYEMMKTMSSVKIEWHPLLTLNWTRGIHQGWQRLDKYLNLDGFLKKSLEIKSALKNTGKSLKGLEKSLNSSIFCGT